MGNEFTKAYTVNGMSCQHCVQAVSKEIGALSGVQGVDVDLSAGQVEVRSLRELSREEVAAAVEEAGYVLAD